MVDLPSRMRDAALALECAQKRFCGPNINDGHEPIWSVSDLRTFADRWEREDSERMSPHMGRIDVDPSPRVGLLGGLPPGGVATAERMPLCVDDVGHRFKLDIIKVSVSVCERCGLISRREIR